MDQRFEVRVRFSDGTTNVVTVWEESPLAATDAVRSWLQVVHDLPADSAEFQVRSIGSEPDPRDLRIASAPDAVNHRAFLADGRPIHTRFRVEEERVRQLTNDMRRSPAEGWKEVRTSILAEGMAPRRVAVVNAWETGPNPPEFAIVVTSERRIFTYWRGDYPKVTQTGAIEKLQGPALVEAPDQRVAIENIGPLVEAGLRLLREEARHAGRLGELQPREER